VEALSICDASRADSAAGQVAILKRERGREGCGRRWRGGVDRGAAAVEEKLNVLATIRAGGPLLGCWHVLGFIDIFQAMEKSGGFTHFGR